MGTALWNSIEEGSIYSKNPELYNNHILEQYKIYVEMADRISQRRNLANVFFLTINTSIIAAIGVAIENIENITNRYYIAIGIALLTMCIVWWWILRSFRNLNSAKYKVIGQMEEKLPASPYWAAEWSELGEGKSLKKYLPLTKLEQVVPIVFFAIYLFLIVVVFVGS